MNTVRIAAIVLILAGVLGLVYGGFSYTRETRKADLGPIRMTVSEQEMVNVPMWAGIGATVIGGGLLLLGGRKS